MSYITDNRDRLFQKLVQQNPDRDKSELAWMATWWSARGWLTTKDLQMLFGIKTSTSTKWCNPGWLNARKRGREWAVGIREALAFEPPKRRGRYA